MEIDLIEIEDYKAYSIKPKSFGIQFKNVTFSYNELNILQNACCEIPQNKITAVVGYSGEGKTTMLRLILALLHPQSGHIFITGGKHDFKIEACPSTREWISYVPQGNTLFSGTIRENLLLGNAEATEDEIIDTLKAVCAWSFIEIMPERLNSKIGEHGTSLSEGQAQRIAIARALLRKAPLLILDESTSALDMDTELNVLGTIKRSDRTCILVTHRESPLNICDKIIRINNGAFEEEVPIFNKIKTI